MIYLLRQLYCCYRRNQYEQKENLRNQMFPIEFIFDGPPLSLQSKSGAKRTAYKNRVSMAAKAVLPNGFVPTTQNIDITITYYYENILGDVDNVIKPIQDSLNGIVYDDDHRVVDSRSRRKDINGSYKIKGASPKVLEGFANGRDFVHVKIELSQNNQEL